MPDNDRERLEALKVKIAQKMAQEPGSSLNPVLTEGYRLFLLEIGNGGFGPGGDFP